MNKIKALKETLEEMESRAKFAEKEANLVEIAHIRYGIMPFLEEYLEILKIVEKE